MEEAQLPQLNMLVCLDIYEEPNNDKWHIFQNEVLQGISKIKNLGQYLQEMPIKILKMNILVAVHFLTPFSR